MLLPWHFPRPHCLHWVNTLPSSSRAWICCQVNEVCMLKCTSSGPLLFTQHQYKWHKSMHQFNWPKWVLRHSFQCLTLDSRTSNSCLAFTTKASFNTAKYAETTAISIGPGIALAPNPAEYPGGRVFWQRDYPSLKHFISQKQRL